MGHLDRLPALAEYGRTWIKRSEMVHQEGYSKAHITKADSGLRLDFIMYNAIGVEAKSLKQAFIVDIIREAQERQLCLVPLALAHPFPDEEKLPSEEKLCGGLS